MKIVMNQTGLNKWLWIQLVNNSLVRCDLNYFPPKNVVMLIWNDMKETN